MNDKEIVRELLKIGLKHDQAMKVLGFIVELRLDADHEGYKRGFNDASYNITEK